MRILTNLFARSPFAPLQAHMERVVQCVHKMEELFEVYFENHSEKIEALTAEVSELEHMADLTKNEIRNNLPKGLFLAVNRADLLEILALQDSLADKAEDVAVLLTIKHVPSLVDLRKDIQAFLTKNIAIVDEAHRVIREMDELLEATFGGKEAEQVKLIIDQVAYMEHEADIQQRELLKKLFAMEDSLSYSDFFLWINILQSIAALGNLSEKLCNRIRMLLEIK